jgi:hypothetical protein
MRKHLIEKLRLDQMNLPQIGMRSEPFDMVEMLIGGPGMGIAFHTVILDQLDGVCRSLAESMTTADLDADNVRGFRIV